MTMPKKGLRKIVVDEETYKYVVKPYEAWGNVRGGSVTIEKPDGTYISRNIEGGVTPSMVEELIRENF